MTAAEALRTARAAGVEIALDGDDLVLEASSPPPEPVLEALSRNKAGIVALLRPGGDGWSAEGWQVYFDERAGIAEFDGGLPRPAAEAQAFACCVSDWMNRHPATSSPERCLACGGVTGPAIPRCPMGRQRMAMPGCIPAAGQAGTRPLRPRPSTRLKSWASKTDRRPRYQELMGGADGVYGVMVWECVVCWYELHTKPLDDEAPPNETGA